MVDFVTHMINGILTGLLFALVGMGFTIIYRSGRVFNLAQGEIVMVGAFLLSSFAAALEWPLWFSLILAFFLNILLGLVIERIVLRPLIGEEIFALVMATLGALIFIRGAIIILWGTQTRFFPIVIPMAGIKIGPLILDRAIVAGGGITIILAAGISWFFNHTRMGLEMTAVAEDHQIAQSLGLTVKRSMAVSWGASGVLSTLAAIIFLNGKGMSFLASEIGFAALPVVLLAGMESIGGLILSGIIVGLSMGVASYALDPVFQGGVTAVFPFIIMIIILLIFPSGLFGWKTIERV